MQKRIVKEYTTTVCDICGVSIEEAWDMYKCVSCGRDCCRTHSFKVIPAGTHKTDNYEIICSECYKSLFPKKELEE